MGNRSQRNREQVSCMPSLTFSDEGSLFNQIREVAGRCSGRRAGYRAIFSSAHAAFKSFRSFLKHPQERFLLSLVNFCSETVKQFGFVDEKFSERKRSPLRFNRCPREPREPGRDFIRLVRVL